MTAEEARRLLNPDTREEALNEIECNGGGIEAGMKAFDEACMVAIEVLEKQITVEREEYSSENNLGDDKTIVSLNGLFKLIKELDEYKNLEEQNRLIKLPCAVGDTVWFIGTECDKYDCWKYSDYCHRGCEKLKIPKIKETIIKQFRMLGNQFDEMTDTTALASTASNDFYLRDIGKTVFLTREEAEQKLKEMEA